MPVEYRLEPGANLVMLTFKGKVSYDDVAAAFLDRVRQPDYRPGMNILADGRQASFDISTQDMVRLVALFEQRRQERGVGFRFALASGEDLTFGLGRMFEAHAARLPEQIRVFRDLEEARRWVMGGAEPAGG